MSPVAEQEEQEVPTCVTGWCPGEGMGAGAWLFLFICKGTPASCRWQNRHRFLHLCCNTEKEGLLELVKTIYIFVYIFSLFVYFYASFARWFPVWVLPSLCRFAQTVTLGHPHSTWTLVIHSFCFCSELTQIKHGSIWMPLLRVTFKHHHFRSCVCDSSAKWGM